MSGSRQDMFLARRRSWWPRDRALARMRSYFQQVEKTEGKAETHWGARHARQSRCGPRGHGAAPHGLEDRSTWCALLPRACVSSCPRTHAACIRTHVPRRTRARMLGTHTGMRPHTYRVAHTHETVTGKGPSAVSSAVGRSRYHIGHIINVRDGCVSRGVRGPPAPGGPHTPPRSLPARLCPPCSPSVLAPRPLPVGTRGLVRPDTRPLRVTRLDSERPASRGRCRHPRDVSVHCFHFRF